MIRAAVLFLVLLLKILGWTLLILLLLLAVVLLLVLFVPLRYDVQMQNERSMEPGQNHPAANLRLQLKVTWLLHLLHVSVSYGPEGMQNQIRAAGINVPEMLAQFAKKKEEKRRETEKKKSSKKKSKNSLEHEKAAGDTDPAVQEQKEENSSVSSRMETEENSGVPSEMKTEENRHMSEKSADDAQRQALRLEENAKKDFDFKTEKQKKSLKKAKRPSKKVKKPSKKTMKSRKEAGAKTGEPGVFSKIRTQFGRLHKELTDETNRHAASHLWRELLKLLRSYKPRKLKADLSFSLADPALTGQVTGVISLLPFIYRYPCSIIPDFTSEKLYIEGEVLARGKVSVYVFLLSLLRLLRDKEFMKVIRRLMKRDGT